MYAALTESEAARKQTAATVWPYLQLEITDYANEEAPVAQLVEDGQPAFGRNFIIGRVLTPGESVTLLQTGEPSLVAAFRRAVAEPGTGLQVCYCSIFDDCWVRDSRDDTADPQSVEACPDYGEAGFRFLSPRSPSA